MPTWLPSLDRYFPIRYITWIACAVLLLLGAFTEVIAHTGAVWAVLGGIGSLPGAMIGGVLIGLIESFWGGYVNAEYKDVAVFATLMLVLLIRPNGLFGRPEIEKV